MGQGGFKRKLTAILSADAVGYSSLMADDETATVKTLTAYREVMSSLIKKHNMTRPLPRANKLSILVPAMLIFMTFCL